MLVINFNISTSENPFAQQNWCLQKGRTNEVTPDLAYCYVFLTIIRRNMSEWKAFYSQDRMVDQAMGKGKNKPQAE